MPLSDVLRVTDTHTHTHPPVSRMCGEVDTSETVVIDVVVVDPLPYASRKEWLETLVNERVIKSVAQERVGSRYSLIYIYQ